MPTIKEKSREKKQEPQRMTRKRPSAALDPLNMNDLDLDASLSDPELSSSFSKNAQLTSPLDETVNLFLNIIFWEKLIFLKILNFMKN